MRAEWHPFPAFAWRTLGRRLRPAERAAVDRTVRALLRFQETLDRWPAVRGAAHARTHPDATPFVSLYAGGRLLGCYGDGEGPPAERLARAFLRAAHDDRFGGPRDEDRPHVAAQVSYPVAARLIDPETAEETIEVGTHGVAFVGDGAQATILLPHVARDQRLGPREMIVTLARKAGKIAVSSRDVPHGTWTGGGFYLFEADDVVVRRGRAGGAGGAAKEHAAETLAGADAEDAAAAWLASLVDAGGRIAFAVDPRAPEERRRVAVGEMHHGRAAVVVQALAAHGGYGAAVARARRTLAADARAALDGRDVAGWPTDPAAVAGTLALAVLAGVPLRAELAAYLRATGAAATATPWHAGQVVAALGVDAPAAAWDACVADLARRPFAPWTVLAAAARARHDGARPGASDRDRDRERAHDRAHDRAVGARAALGVEAALRRAAPHRGGAVLTLHGADADPRAVPETALTAIAVEALAVHRAGAGARDGGRARSLAAAIARGAAFVARRQLVGSRLYGALDADAAYGAFAATPVNDLLRGDVTAHALLASRAARAG